MAFHTFCVCVLEFNLEHKCLHEFFFCCLTSSLPQPVKFPGWKVHTYMPADSIYDGPVTNLPSVLCILIEIFSRVHAKGERGLNDFKFGTVLARFQKIRRGSERAKYPEAKKPSRSCKRWPPTKTNRGKYSATSSLNKGSASSEVHVSRMPELHPAKTD